MVELIKRILLSKGVNIADIKISRIKMEVRKGIIIPTDDWNVTFEYQDQLHCYRAERSKH